MYFFEGPLVQHFIPFFRVRKKKTLSLTKYSPYFRIFQNDIMITKESSSLVDSKKDGVPQPPILQLEEPSTQLSNQADDSGILTNPGDRISLQELNKNNGDEPSRPSTSPQTASTQVASNRQLLGLEAEDDQSSAVQPSSAMTATMAGTVLCFKSNNPFKRL